jgi:hypothetical protein
MAYNPILPAGQATMAASAPVVIASNQTVLPQTINQLNGVAISVGNGVSGTGVQRVSIASDSTGNIATIGTSVTPGTAATNLGKAEDAGHTTGDTGVAVWSVRRDSLNAASPTSVAGDYQQISTDTEGVVWVRPQGVYNSTPPTVTNTNRTDLQTDVTGSLKVTQEITTYAQDLGTDTDLSIKASAGRFKSVHVTNANAAVRYFQIHNKATAPVNPDAPLLSIPIPAGTATVPGVLDLGTDFFRDYGLVLSTGIATGISTTATTYTAATAADHFLAVMYV